MDQHKTEQSKREEWVMIGHLNYDVDAEIVSSLFQGHQIPVLIQGRNHRRMLGFVGGYIQLRVLVPQAYQEQGHSLLDTYHQQRDDHDFTPPSDEELIGERSWLWFSETSKKMGIALFLAAFLGFGLASLSAGLWWCMLILAPLQIAAYIPEMSSMLSKLFSISPENYQASAKLYIPLLDLMFSWVYLIYRVSRVHKSTD